MNKINYSLIGCGAAGKVHAYYFSKERENFISISDPQEEAINTFDLLFHPQTKYSDYHKMFLNEKINCVSIASPPSFHHEQVLEAAKNKIHILCEKPLATNLQDAKEIIKNCKNFGVTLGIMLPRRFYNNSRLVKEVLEKGILGKIITVSFVLECQKDKFYYSNWRGKKSIAGGGILMNQAIHSIDQLVYFFGKPKKVNGKIKTTRDYLEVEDEAEGIIEFKNGVIVKLSATANSDKVWQGITTIIGEKGRIILNSAETILWDVPGVEKPLLEEEEQISTKFKPHYYGPGHQKVIHNFIDSIKNNHKPFVSGEDSLDSLKIILGIYKSSENEGKIIELNQL